MIGRIYIITRPEIAPALPKIEPTLGTVKPMIVVNAIAQKLKINPAFVLIVGFLNIVDDTISQIIWNNIGNTVNIYKKLASQIIVGKISAGPNIAKAFYEIEVLNALPENPIYPKIPTST